MRRPSNPSKPDVVTVIYQDSLSEVSHHPGEALGDYRLEEKIATGGYGSVWRASSRVNGETVAIKLLHESLVSSEEAVGRFVQEAKAIGAIDHRGVVKLHAVERTSEGQPYMVTELIAGEDLSAFVGRGPMKLAMVTEIAQQLASALDAVHEVGLVHRDIKPGNVMLTRDDAGMRVVLLDFGIAKLANGEGPGLTASRFTVGTPASMAPEQLRGEPVSARTDVYGLGALVYTLLTGELPFAASPAMLLPALHLHGDRPKPSAVIDSCRPLDAIVERAMDKDPEQRFESAAALASALATALAAMQESGSTDTSGAEFVGISVGVSMNGDSWSECNQDQCDDILDQSATVLEDLGYSVLRETGNSIVFGRELVETDGAVQVLAQLRLLRQLVAKQAPTDCPFSLVGCCHVADTSQALVELAAWELRGSNEPRLYGSERAIERLRLPTCGTQQDGVRRLDL